MCSRVYAVLGRPEPALWHARRAVTLVGAGGAAVEDWDRPAVYEAMARASFVAGDASEGAAWKTRSAELAAALADADDREVIERDLATLPRWRLARRRCPAGAAATEPPQRRSP